MRSNSVFLLGAMGRGALLAALWWGAACAARAQYWVTHKPGAVRETVAPLMDIPLRDTFLTRAPDGRWYLTGTRPSAKDAADFANNDGVEVWASADLKQWESLGQVWSIEKDAKKSPKSAWQIEYRADANEPEKTRCRAMTAPEIHFLKGGCYLTYSMNGHGTGLLKSTTGKPEGPYEDLGRITRQGGGDASMFEDADGKVYWLWGEGWIALMREDLGGLAGAPVSLLAKITNDGAPNFMRMWWQKTTLRGPFLCRANGRYLLTLDTWTTRLTGPCNDSLIAGSDNLMGPYERPLIFGNHSGQTCIFQTGEKEWAAAVSGPDTWSAFRDRPAMVPLFWEDSTKTFMRVRGNHYSEMGDFHKATPIKVKPGADPEMLQAPDGYYYYIASAILPGKLLLYRSKALDTENDWEEILVDTAESIAANPAWPAQPVEGGQKLEDPKTANIWEGSHMWHNNRLYIAAGLLGLAAEGGRKTGIGLWRSREGTGAGPYEFVGRIAENDGLSMFADDDGRAYLLTGFGGLRRFKADMTGLDLEFKAASTEWADKSQINYDCGWHLLKLDGKYVRFIIYYLGSYSSAYGVADKIEGPYEFKGVCMPHGGNSPLFKDLAGQWWMLGWGNTDYCVPFDGSPPWMEPMTVESRGGELVIEPRYRSQGGKR